MSIKTLIFISIFNSTNPQCYYLKKLQGETSQRSLYITFISDNAVYAYGHSYYDTTIINFSLYLFNPKTLKMIKALNMDTGWKIYRGYRSFELNRDIMFWTNSVSMNKIYFNETLDHILEYYSFNFNITSSIYANYYIKETKNGNFFMTIEQDYNYGNYGESKREVMTFKFDSNLNTNSWLNLTQKSTDDYLFNLPIGANASSGLSIYYVNIVPNIFITNSSSFYSKTSSVSDYYITDVTNWIWPRFIPNLWDCAFPLPSFILLSSYNIHIGKDFQTNSVFIPFDHWQNARFVIHAINENDNLIPVWLTVDQSSQSIIFNMSLINSVGIYNISMNARLITFSINSTDTSVYTTQNNTSRFNFYNTNWYFVNSNTTYYLVFEQTSNFQFLFFDEEGDDIIIQTSQNDYIGIFVQNINNSNQYKMLLQANSVLNESTTLFIQYTDSYHQDAYFIKNMTLEFYLFEVDPPYFSSVPPVVNATRWSNLLIILPQIKDPNGLNWFVSIDSTSPEWVNLFDNNTLLLKTANLSYSISDTTLISLKISNEKNAWRMYNLTIKTEHYSYPSFGIVNNIIAHFNITTETRLDVNSNIELQVVDWKSNETIPWIKYLQQNFTLQIKPSNISLKIQCAKLASIDSCQSRVYSSQFLVTVIQSSGPPIIGNTFGPLNVYKGESKLFIIPEDLFISDKQHTLNYTSSVLSWSIKSILYTNVTKSNFDSKSYLYILSKDAKTCLVTISATDSNNQSAETTVQINVLNWASKDWLEWKSQYQADWVKWKESYTLGADGVWYWKTTFFPDSSGSLFDIWGLIVLISLIVSLMLSITIGMRSLYTLEFSHTIIIYIASLSNQSLIKLILWFQIFKLDFGFLDQFHIRYLLFCQVGSDEMSKIQFYWQSTILNYFYLIIILLVLAWWLQILKKTSLRLKITEIVLSFIQNKSNENISWIVWHLFSSFLWVNLLSDALNIYNHTILSLISLFLFLVIIIFILIKYPKVITLSFIKKIDHSRSPILALFTILKSICNAFLFHFRDLELRRILLTIGLLLHIPFILVIFIESKEISLLDLYSAKMRWVKIELLLHLIENIFWHVIKLLNKTKIKSTN